MLVFLFCVEVLHCHGRDESTCIGSCIVRSRDQPGWQLCVGLGLGFRVQGLGFRALGFRV